MLKFYIYLINNKLYTNMSRIKKCYSNHKIPLRNYFSQNIFPENDTYLNKYIRLIKKNNFDYIVKDENINNIKRRIIKTKNKNGEYVHKKRKRNFKRVNYNLKFNFSMIIAFLFFYNILEVYLQTRFNSYLSIITIKINQSGRHNILYGGNSCDRNELYDRPDEIIINNAKQYLIETYYDFEGTNNIIQLKWNEPRENWGCLFQYCEDINEIDFSQFDFSQKIRGNKMLRQCRSITSININDFGKVKLIDAGSFFREMSSLTSLNLSNFDMSEVTDIG